MLGWLVLGTLQLQHSERKFITSGARSEFFCGLREKSQYARPNPTRPHHAFEKLISLERVDRFTSGLLCSMSPFNKFHI